MAAYFSVVTNNSLRDCAPSSLNHPPRSPSLQPRAKPHLLPSHWIQKELVLAQKIRGEVEEGMKLPELSGLLGVTGFIWSSAWGTIPFFAGKETRVGVWK